MIFMHYTYLNRLRLRCDQTITLYSLNGEHFEFQVEYIRIIYLKKYN